MVREELRRRHVINDAQTLMLRACFHCPNVLIQVRTSTIVSAKTSEPWVIYSTVSRYRQCL